MVTITDDETGARANRVRWAANFDNAGNTVNHSLTVDEGGSITVNVEVTSVVGGTDLTLPLSFWTATTAAQAGSEASSFEPSEVVFPAGSQAAQQVTITVPEDDVVNGARTVALLIDPAYSQGGFQAASGNILQIPINDNDTAKTIELTAPVTATVDEGHGEFLLNLTASHTLPEEGLVLGADANNALVRLKDPITGSSTVRVYNDKAFIPFEVLDDGIDQSGDASVTLTLSGGGLPSDWALGTATSFTLTVTDDDDGATAERVGWAQSSITIAEGSSVQVPLRVTTAVPSGASDFTLRTNPSGIRVEIVGDETISFSANDELSKMVTITAVDNAVIEGDQTVTVSLTLETGSSLPTDWQIAETTLTVTITDNDVAGGTIGFDPNLNLRFTEEPNIDSDGNEIAFVRVPVSLTNANGDGPGIVPSGGLPLLVTFTESDGNEDADARLFAPPVRIPENAGVYGRYDLLLRIVDDNVPEPDETVTITIAADSGFPFSDWSIPGETNSLNFIIPANDSTGTFRLAPVNQPFDETLANGNVLTHQGVNDSARSLHERERLLMTFSAPTPQGLVIKAEATEAGSGNVTTPGGPMRLVQADGTLGMSRDFPIPAGVTHYWFPISNMATGRGRITLTNESKSQALKDNWTDERNASDQSFGYITFTVSNSEISIAGNSASRVAEGTNRAIYLTFDRPVPEGAGFDLLAFIPAINNGDMAHSNAQDQRGTISPTSTSSLYQTGIGQTTGGINGCNPNGNNCVLITVPEGSRGAEILFSAAQDDTPEADESVNVTFQLRSGESLPTGWQFSGGGRQLIHTVTIPYNDIRVSHESLNVFTAKEGEEPAAVIRIDAPLHDPGSGNRLLDPSIVPTDGISLLVTTTLPEDVRLQLAGESGAGTLTSDKTITLTSSSSTGNVTFFGTQIKVVPVDDNLEEGNEVGELIISEDPDNPLPNGWRITNARRDLVVTDGASQTNGVIRFDTLQTDFEKVLETDPVPPQRSQENKTWRITERGTDYSRELTLRTTEQASASYTVTATIKEPDGDDAADVTAGSVTVATTVGVGDEIKLPITIEADSIREGVEVVEISLASSNLPSGWAIDSERGTIYLQIWDNLVYFESLLQIVEPGDLLNLRISMPPATADTTLSAIVSPSGSGIVSVGAVSFGIGKTEATVPVQISETGIPNAGVDVDIFLTGTLPEGVKFAANSSAQNPSGTFTRLRLEPRNNVIAFADTKSSTVDTAGTLPSRLQLVYPEAPGLWVSSAGENTVQVPTDLIVDEYGIHRPAEGAKPTGTIKIHVRSNNPFVTLDNDATPEETVVSLVAGTTSTSIPVTIPDDFIAGLDKSLVEVVRFTMTPAEELPIGWLLSQHDVHEMTITNNVAPTVHFAEDFVSVREDVGFHPIEISLTDPAPANGLTLQLTSENNARVSVPDNGVVSFAAGETSKSVTLTIVDNDGDEILGAARGNLVGLTLTGDLPSGWEYYQPPGSDQLVSLVVTVGAPTRTVLTAADPNETSMLLHILEDDKVIRFAANLPTRMIEGGSAQTITLIASEAPTSNIALDATTMVHSNSGRTIQLTPANAVISAGSTTATFTISAQEHSSITNPEQVSVLISPDAGGAPGITGLPEGWIFEPSQTDSSGNLAHLMWAEDNDGETVGFASTSTSETFEGATNAVLNLELSAAAPDGTRYARSVVNQFGARIVTKGALVFTVRSSDYSNAHPRDDFVVVPHGDTTFAIPLRIPVDQRVENEAQDVTFTLIPNAGYELKDNGTPNDPSDDVWESLWPAGWRVAPQTHTVRILPDNTPAIYFTGNRTKHLVLERFSDEQGALALQIGLSVPAPKNFNVVLTTTERDRDPYADVSLPSVIPVPEGARSVEVPVTIINDILVEAANETVDIAIDASRLPRGWRLGRESHRIVLLPSDERNRQNVEFSTGFEGRNEDRSPANFFINVGQPDATPPFDVIIRNEDPEFFGWTDPVTGAITDRMTVRVTLPRVVPPPAVGTATLTIPWAGDTDSDAENYKIYMEAGANFPSSRRLGGRNITELRIITDDVTVPVPLTPVAPPPVSGTATLTFRGLPFTVPSKTEADGATAFVSADLTAAAPTGGLPLNMTITRKDGSTDPITNDIASVSVASSGSSQGQTTLTYGGDVADGNFTIPAGDTNFIATLTLANDNVAESDEIFIITFTQGSNFPTSWGSIPAGGITHEFTINDDDSAVGTNTAGFFTASGSGTEGASRSPGVVLDFTAAPPSGGLPLKLTITREDTTNTDAISTDITGVSVSGRGTITYTGTPASGSFTVPATDQSVRVTFDLADDNVAESSEVFVITLEAGDNFPTSWGSVPAGTTHKLTINDDDAPTRGTATLDISANGTDASATEGTGAQANILLRPSAAVPGSGLPLNMTITRKDGSTDPITNDIASIQLSGISTLPNPTGTVANSSFTIPDGFATVLVTFVLVNDTTVESAEEFIITFTEGTGFPISWGSVPANTSHELTINDDDGP